MTHQKSMSRRNNNTTMQVVVASQTLAFVWALLGCCCYCTITTVQAQTAPTPALAAFNDPTVKSLIRTTDPVVPSAKGGSARLAITKGNNNVQISNYNWGSFELENTGPKRIAAVFIDVTDSIFSDIVFDADGSGGDNVAKSLSIDSNGGNVGAVSINNYNEFWLPARTSSFKAGATFDANQLSNVNNLFVDATADNSNNSPKAGGGFRGELLLFTDFTSDEKVSFSGDMDPNSIAGLTKGTVDSGANWDVGGVSGSEMINGVVTVLFGDGSTASGTIAPDGSQSGSVAIIHNDLVEAPELIVNGIAAGGSGSYSTLAPVVTLRATPGATVRVSKVEGFDPTASTKLVGNGQITVKNLVTARLKAQYAKFPANNAKKWQHVQVTIPQSGSTSINISNQFVNDHGQNPIAFSAVIINSGSGEPISRTVKPIRLVFSATAVPVATPVRAPVVTPVRAPVATPVRIPVRAPVVTPVRAPVATPVRAPVRAPVATPVRAPFRAPVVTPVRIPVRAPVAAPVRVPVPTSVCTKQKFVGECKLTSVCKRKYPSAVDCKNNEGGICYCQGNVVCGCQK